MNKTYGYARVSTKEQNLDRQLVELRRHVENERDIVVDKSSGKDFDRPGYISLRDVQLRCGDTLVIKELDRLGRNMAAIKTEWEGLLNKGVDIIVVDTPMLSTAGKDTLEKRLISNIVFELMSYMAEKEREKIRSRQAEGIAAAKAKGRNLGTPTKYFVNDIFKVAYASWKTGEHTAVATMKGLGLKPSTFYRKVKELEKR